VKYWPLKIGYLKFDIRYSIFIILYSLFTPLVFSVAIYWRVFSVSFSRRRPVMSKRSASKGLATQCHSRTSLAGIQIRRACPEFIEGASVAKQNTVLILCYPCLLFFLPLRPPRFQRFNNYLSRATSHGLIIVWFFALTSAAFILHPPKRIGYNLGKFLIVHIFYLLDGYHFAVADRNLSC